MSGTTDNVDVRIGIEVNGETRRLGPGTSVGGLLAELGYDRRGLAVAVGDEVVPRRQWDDRPLVDGDRVEILTIAQGG